MSLALNSDYRIKNCCLEKRMINQIKNRLLFKLLKWPKTTKVSSKLTRTYSSKHGLKDLVNEILDIQLDKTEQSSDWSKKKLTKKQIEYAMNDVLYLSEIKNSLNNKLLNQKRLKMFKSIMKFMEVRVDLDLQGWEEIDIFAHK